ncbi:hypothetical protein MMC14_002537 [Varicellaria rhodocarpa]|nr:hypothetical protein [Varicellaria rhodocarpa]
MTLVGYSDSEGSGDEDSTISEVLQKKPTPNPSKSTFQKVIDRSNPHKIKISLPDAVKDDENRGDDGGEPPAKKAKTGAGAFSAFNSLLPAPKRAGTASRGPSSSRAKRGGLGSGINLRTGAAPGFSREPMPEREIDEENEIGGIKNEDKPTGVYLPNEKIHGTQNTIGNASSGIGVSKMEPKRQGNPIMFKPLSVARKPQKKKKAIAESVLATPEIPTGEASVQPKSSPKPSLFSLGPTLETKADPTGPSGEYQPLIYDKREAPSEESPETNLDDELDLADIAVSNSNPKAPINNNGPQSLDSIAADLNLSAAAKRQLLGRQRNNKTDVSAINVVNFNTDQEYAANELLRQAGEQVQHNPVRAVAAGKHSLKQLVNAASNQKEALEEHFATGRRNKKEAGSKYGW